MGWARIPTGRSRGSVRHGQNWDRFGKRTVLIVIGAEDLGSRVGYRFGAARNDAFNSGS